MFVMFTFPIMAVRAVLKAQETDQPWRDLQVKLRIAWSSFVRDFGPINHTKVSITEKEETGETREILVGKAIRVCVDDDQSCSFKTFVTAAAASRVPGPWTALRHFAPRGKEIRAGERCAAWRLRPQPAGDEFIFTSERPD